MTRLVLHDAALADGRSDILRTGVSLSISDGNIDWIRPNDDADLTGAEVFDVGGATIVPALVDGHSHLTGQGGSHLIERLGDPPDVLKRVARDNARRLVQAGVLWAIDVGSPAANGRAVSLDVRDELRGKTGQPYIRAAGTWIAKTGYLPLCVEVEDGDALRRAALAQLDSGSDLVKIMLDEPPIGSGAPTSPFTTEDVRRTVEAVHARVARITAHSTTFAGARVGAEAGLDSIQHGFQLDDDTARIMARNNVALVSTLSVFPASMHLATTTSLDRYASEAGRKRTAEQYEGAKSALAAAQRAGVTIACGSDFGGSPGRAGQLAWEVELLVDAGLPPRDALAAATWRGGEVVGEPTAGKIEPGMPADLVLVHGDPLSDARALWHVWAVFQAGARVA
jgi:imidazolonepropionase-like amidohydrolase